MDGVEPKGLRDTMELEIANLEDEAEHPSNFWHAAGGYSPTIGILGRGSWPDSCNGKPNGIPANWAEVSQSLCGDRSTEWGLQFWYTCRLPASSSSSQKPIWLPREIMLVGVISILEGRESKAN